MTGRTRSSGSRVAHRLLAARCCSSSACRCSSSCRCRSRAPSRWSSRRPAFRCAGMQTFFGKEHWVEAGMNSLLLAAAVEHRGPGPRHACRLCPRARRLPWQGADREQLHRADDRAVDHHRRRALHLLRQDQTPRHVLRAGPRPHDPGDALCRADHAGGDPVVRRPDRAGRRSRSAPRKRRSWSASCCRTSLPSAARGLDFRLRHQLRRSRRHAVPGRHVLSRSPSACSTN